MPRHLKTARKRIPRRARDDTKYKKKGFTFQAGYPTYKQLLTKSDDPNILYGKDENGVLYLNPWITSFKDVFEKSKRPDEHILFFVVPPSYTEQNSVFHHNEAGMLVRDYAQERIAHVHVNLPFPNQYNRITFHNKFSGASFTAIISKLFIPSNRKKCGHCTISLI